MFYCFVKFFKFIFCLKFVALLSLVRPVPLSVIHRLQMSSIRSVHTGATYTIKKNDKMMSCYLLVLVSPYRKRLCPQSQLQPRGLCTKDNGHNFIFLSIDPKVVF